MDNNLNPFAPKTNSIAYNRIKRNRAFRSEKKLTQEHLVKPFKEHKPSLRTELRALIQESPCDERDLISCIDELRQKLHYLKNSPQKRQEMPLQQHHFSRKHSESANQKYRYKTNTEQSCRKNVSKSLNLLSHKDPSGLLNLQEMRNEIKRRKQSQRLPTQKQSIEGSHSQSKRKPGYQDIKVRSVTEEVIRSQRNPARIYHYSSPRRIPTSVQNREENLTHEKQLFQDNDEATSPPQKKERQKENVVIDNNQKIGDLSTIIAKQKQTLNFLGDSCMGIKQELSPQKHDPNTSKMLEFVGWKTNELKNVFSQSKKKKRKAGLDKLSKIFPKGFFT